MENTNYPARYVAELEQINRQLTQQRNSCQEQLTQMQTTLTEAQRVLAENYRLEAERNRILAQEYKLNELKSNFVTLASHEFRTPMMTIMSSASLIGRYKSEADSDKRDRHVQRIKSAVESLLSMLTDFLAISQVDQDTVVSHPQLLDLVTFCQDVLTEVQALAKLHQRLQYTHGAGTAMVTIDGQMLKQILLNLLTNASKYSAEGTDIQLTSAVAGNELVITVRDQGIGIPDVDKDKLFVNFFRARNAIHIQGTGLGLYLVKRYVDLLGGRISFTSEMGQGTTFTVQLPLATFGPL